MENSIFKQAAAYLRKHRNDRRWHQVVLCLALIVVLGTVLVLKLPGQAQTHQVKALNCQLSVHSHAGHDSADCYEADYVVHTHNADCYQDGTLVCTLPEIKEHTHDSDCYSQNQVLTCGQSEYAGHTHSDSCYTEYETEYETEDGEIEVQVTRELTCGQDEYAGHTHDSSCYTTVSELTCGELEMHTHADSCCDSYGNVICGQVELVEHIHSEAAGCFETIELTDEEVAALNEPADTTETQEAAETTTTVFFSEETEDEETASEEPASDEDEQIEDEQVDETAETDQVEAEETLTQTAEADGYVVTVQYTAAAQIPEDAELRITVYDQDSEAFQQYSQQAGTELDWLLDIGFYVDDEEIEPAAPVSVSVQVAGGTTSNTITHFTEDGPETVTPDNDGETVDFVLDSFSVVGGSTSFVEEESLTSEVTSTLNAGETVILAYTISTENDYALASNGKSALIGKKYDDTDTSQQWEVQSNGTLKNVATGEYLSITSNGVSLGGSGTKILYAYNKIYSIYTGTQTSYGRQITTYTARGIQMYKGTSSIETSVGYATSSTETSETSATPSSYATNFTIKKVVNSTVKKYTATATTKLAASGDTATLAFDELTFPTDANAPTGFSGFKWSDSQVSVNNGSISIASVTADITVTGTYADAENNVTYTLTWNITVPKTYTVTYKVSSIFTPGTVYDSNNATGWYYGDIDSKTQRTAANADETYVIGVTGLGTGTVDSGSNFIYTDYSSSDTSYTVKAPTSETRVAYLKNNVSGQGYYLVGYTFTGWQGSDGETYQPGETINLTDGITLTAQWSYSQSTTVGFYINIASNDGGMKIDDDSKYWTDTLVAVSAISTGTGNPFYGVTYDTTTTTTYEQMVEADAYIRQNATSAITKTNGTATLTMSSFPSDAEIFARIQTWGLRSSNTTIEVNGVSVPLSQVNEKNYKILWVKVLYSEFWHVDGILVPKDGTLTVTKTFVGDETAIENVKENYTISVKQGSTEAYALNLNEKTDSANNTKTSMGYTSYDAATNTYTWVLSVSQLKDYTVVENKYTASGYTTSATYQITGADETQYNTDGWQKYTSTGTAAFRCYATSTDADTSTTVNLRNVYVKPWTMSIFKTDGTTSHALSGVTFTLKFWQCDANGSVDTTAEPTDIQTVISDGNGNIDFSFEENGEGTYAFTLTEADTTGYTNVGTIYGTATVKSNGAVTATITQVDGIADNTSVKLDGSGAILNITNYSERATLTVTKVWTDGTDKPVKMQVLRNGQLVEGAVAELTSSNSWTYTWDDLPLYVDGEKATYSVREIQIGADGTGDARQYNANDDTDGYKAYDVIVSNVTETKDSDGNVSYSVTVQNTKDDGQVRFTKVDENNKALSGAVFTVYTDEDCTQVAKITTNGAEKDAQFTSNDYGVVTITGLSEGTYYVKETQAPSGYMPGGTVYKLEARTYNSKLYAGLNTTEQLKTVTNSKAQLTITLVKRATGSSDTAVNLTGAKFKLYSDTAYENQLGDEIEVTSTDGVVIDQKLKEGTYYLVETQAPAGYNLLTAPVVLTVKSDGTLSITSSSTDADAQVNVNDPYAYTVTVYNTTGVELPHTGGTGTLPYTLCGLAILAVGFVYGFGMGRRRERGLN